MIMQLLPEVDIVIRAFDSGDNPLDTKDIFAATQDVRVFVIAMYPIHAKQVLCEVSTFLYTRFTSNSDIHTKTNFFTQLGI